MSRVEPPCNILTCEDEIVKGFRSGLMHRIAKREVLEQEVFFERLVRSVISPGEIDITDWNKDAIRILLSVCSDSRNEYVIVNSGMKLSFVRYPNGILFERLAEAIAAGELT